MKKLYTYGTIVKKVFSKEDIIRFELTKAEFNNLPKEVRNEVEGDLRIVADLEGLGAGTHSDKMIRIKANERLRDTLTPFGVNISNLVMLYRVTH